MSNSYETWICSESLRRREVDPETRETLATATPIWAAIAGCNGGMVPPEIARLVSEGECDFAALVRRGLLAAEAKNSGGGPSPRGLAIEFAVGTETLLWRTETHEIRLRHEDAFVGEFHRDEEFRVEIACQHEDWMGGCYRLAVAETALRDAGRCVEADALAASHTAKLKYEGERTREALRLEAGCRCSSSDEDTHSTPCVVHGKA